MTAPEIRRLTQDDYPAFERFLGARAESSMFLRSNARAAGLDYAGEAFQARYFGALEAVGGERQAVGDRALGFQQVGDYHIALIDPGVRLASVAAP